MDNKESTDDGKDVTEVQKLEEERRSRAERDYKILLFWEADHVCPVVTHYKLRKNKDL